MKLTLQLYSKGSQNSILLTLVNSVLFAVEDESEIIQ